MLINYSDVLSNYRKKYSSGFTELNTNICVPLTEFDRHREQVNPLL